MQFQNDAVQNYAIENDTVSKNAVSKWCSSKWCKKMKFQNNAVSVFCNFNISQFLLFAVWNDAISKIMQFQKWCHFQKLCHFQKYAISKIKQFSKMMQFQKLCNIKNCAISKISCWIWKKMHFEMVLSDQSQIFGTFSF